MKMREKQQKYYLYFTDRGKRERKGGEEEMEVQMKAGG